MPDQKPIALPSEGGSYVLDPKTGQPVLVERTQATAVDHQHDNTNAAEIVIDSAPTE